MLIDCSNEMKDEIPPAFQKRLTIRFRGPRKQPVSFQFPILSPSTATKSSPSLILPPIPQPCLIGHNICKKSICVGNISRIVVPHEAMLALCYSWLCYVGNKSRFPVESLTSQVYNSKNSSYVSESLNVNEVKSSFSQIHYALSLVRIVEF